MVKSLVTDTRWMRTGIPACPEIKPESVPCQRPRFPLDCGMVHTFATREEAAIFATAMRSDGYFAEILDDGMGSIYGPLAIGGIRVVVSDEPMEESADEAGHPGQTEDGEFLRTLRLFVVGIAGLGLCVVAFMLLWLVLQLIRLFSADPAAGVLAFFHLLKFPLGIALIFVIAAPMMTGFTRWLRGEQLSVASELLRALLLALLIPFLILMVL